MIGDRTLRKLSKKTQSGYIRWVKRLSRQEIAPSFIAAEIGRTHFGFRKK